MNEFHGEFIRNSGAKHYHGQNLSVIPHKTVNQLMDNPGPSSTTVQQYSQVFFGIDIDATQVA